MSIEFIIFVFVISIFVFVISIFVIVICLFIDKQHDIVMKRIDELDKKLNSHITNRHLK